MLAASSPNPSNLPSAAHHARRAPTGGAPTQVLKRDGRTQPFDRGRIERALALCFYDINERPKTSLLALAERVITRLAATPTATVEQIQDVVVTILREQGEQAAVAHYTTYRSAAAAARDERPIPEAVRERYRRDALYFPSALQQFQFYDKYARFNTRQGMRETWAETVSRAVAYLYELASARGMQASDTIWTTLRHAILGMQVMPSMRLLAMAGPAARRQNLALFNCAYLPVDDPAAFGEALLISMSGCGVGYSVERQYVERFPRVQRANMTGARHLVIADTTEGWKEAVDVGVAAWLRGGDVLYDYTQIRPAGAPLAIKGGQASGPAALREALAHIKSIIRARAGATLRPLDAHDIMCHIGSAAVSGGVRRTAMLALFDADDTEMLTCKDGDLSQQQQRYNANNSMVWPDTGVTQVDLMRQMVAMAAEGRGEPGIFNRAAARATKPERRADAEFGVNPCSEIFLRPFGLCNLSSVVARPNDTEESLLTKVRLASFIGTVQSLATHYPGLRPIWSQNAREERLLGVDITGQADCPLLRDNPTLLARLRQEASDVNRTYATYFNIPRSAAITCVKPSGNSSQLLDCASGLHPRFARYYIRNVRLAAASPLYHVLRGAGVPLTPENGQTLADATTWVASFPVAAPEGALVRSEVSALDQCHAWLLLKQHYTDHNPSVTITYAPDELLALTAWLYEHQALIGGMAFLPASNPQYDLLPYTEVTREEYLRAAAAFPEVDYAKLYRYETTDATTAASELACMSGQCDLI